MNKYKILGTCFVLLTLLTNVGCNRDPYLPTGPATYIELGGDGRFGGDNDGQSLLNTIRVMTYNIHACEPPSKPDTTDIGAIAQAIRNGNPDIVFLQEVDKGTNRNGYTGDQAKEIADLLNMNYYFYAARNYLRGFYGVAILSKYPISDIKRNNLTKENDATEQRVLGTAMVDFPGIDSAIIAVTHLQHNSATNRLQQVRDIVNILGNKSDRIIIGGDFNEQESATDFFNIFDGTFTRTCVGSNCAKTFSAQNPTSVIDYLAYRPASAFSVNSHSIVSEFYASDHLPVVAELKFNR
ncbi:MAG: endonuclease/exonuclease/phosphatase family protein [Niabella sp.]